MLKLVIKVLKSDVADLVLASKFFNLAFPSSSSPPPPPSLHMRVEVL
jgi:hypothetical protein